MSLIMILDIDMLRPAMELRVGGERHGALVVSKYGSWTTEKLVFDHELGQQKIEPLELLNCHRLCDVLSFCRGQRD